MRTAALLVGFLLAVLPALSWGAADAPQPTVAVFVQNRAEGLDDQVDNFAGLLEARLGAEGYRVISRQDVIDRFQSQKDPQLREVVEALTEGAGAATLDDASALRLAQMMDADLIAVATLNSLGRRSRTARAFGVTNSVTEYTLRASIKVLDASRGGSAWSDTATVSEKIPGMDDLAVEESPEIVNSLLDDAAGRLAWSMGAASSRLAQAVEAKPGQVPFSVATNGVEGVTVELDGVAIGSTGMEPSQLAASPGIHIIRLTREWFQPWERTVNVYSGQNLTVTLELSEAGLAKYKDLEGFKTAQAIALEQSEAEAYATKQLADGEKKRLEESYERIDTSGASTYAPGDPRVIIKEEK